MAYLIVPHYAMPSAAQVDSGPLNQQDWKMLNPASYSSPAEEDLDLLSAVLGVLVNLVERDDGNRWARIGKGLRKIGMLLWCTNCRS